MVGTDVALLSRILLRLSSYIATWNKICMGSKHQRCEPPCSRAAIHYDARLHPDDLFGFGCPDWGQMLCHFLYAFQHFEILFRSSRKYFILFFATWNFAYKPCSCSIILAKAPGAIGIACQIMIVCKYSISNVSFKPVLYVICSLSDNSHICHLREAEDDFGFDSSFWRWEHSFCNGMLWQLL